MRVKSTPPKEVKDQGKVALGDAAIRPEAVEKDQKQPRKEVKPNN